MYENRHLINLCAYLTVRGGVWVFESRLWLFFCLMDQVPSSVFGLRFEMGIFSGSSVVYSPALLSYKNLNLRHLRGAPGPMLALMLQEACSLCYFICGLGCREGVEYEHVVREGG